MLPAPERRAAYRDIENEPGVAAISLRPGPNAEVTLTAGWVLDGEAIDVVGRREGIYVRALAAGSPAAVDTWEKRTPLPPPRPEGRRAVEHDRPAAVAGRDDRARRGRDRDGGVDVHVHRAVDRDHARRRAAAALLYNQVLAAQVRRAREQPPPPRWLLVSIAVMLGVGVNLPPEGPIGTLIEGALIYGVAMFGLFYERRFVHIVQRMVAAPSEPVAGKPGVFIGTVRDQTPEQFFSQLIAIGTVHKPKPSPDATTLPPERMGFDTTFQLKLPGGDIEIDPRDATWSSEIRNKRDTSSVYLPIDAEVVVVGTPQKVDGRMVMKSTGKDTLCIYGVPEGGDPQAVLRKKLLLRKLAYGATFMIVALAAALAMNGLLARRIATVTTSAVR